MEYSEKQASSLAIARMYQLARAYGHGWAEPVTSTDLLRASQLLRGMDLPFGEKVGKDLLDQVLAELRWEGRPADALADVPLTTRECMVRWCISIRYESSFYPIGPAWEHMTTTKRTRWSISPNTGHTVIEIHRPAGMALRARCNPVGDVQVSCHGDYFARHLFALRTALRAIGLTMPAELWLSVKDSLEELRRAHSEAQARFAHFASYGPSAHPREYEEAQEDVANYQHLRIIACDGELLPKVPMGSQLTAAAVVARRDRLRMDAAQLLSA